MLKNAILNKEESQSSRWWDKETLSLADFYPRPYANNAYYSIALNRFILIDHWDFQTCLHASRLLASKFSLLTTILPTSFDYFSNENCVNWGMPGPDGKLANLESEQLELVKSLEILKEYGPPEGKSSQILLVTRDFVSFVLKATYAMRITESILNKGQSVFFDSFFPDIPENKLHYRVDQTHWPQGFINTLERIIYLSKDIGEIKDTLTKILPVPDKKNKLYPYSKIFYELLGWNPGNSL